MDHPVPLPPSMEMSTSQKRKRSLSVEQPTSPALPAPPMKAPKTGYSHLQINYLARQYQEILPLISNDDTLPSILSLIADYDGVLQRHESMAGNLGARPLGPILIQRFERLFDGPPRVLKTHGKGGATATWLDVVEFARNKPEQFNLERMRDGVRVCQFYTKQCRVEISEEDYVLIASGLPQKLIPPQPIGEDEEKELGTLEILEKSLGGVVQLADQVSARARQLNHRLRNRKSAIVSRRDAERMEASSKDDRLRSPVSQSHNVEMTPAHTNGDGASISPTSGFVAVNSRLRATNDTPFSLGDTVGSASGISTNGLYTQGASAATHAELLSKFCTSSERSTMTSDLSLRRDSASASRPELSKPKPRNSTTELDYPEFLLNQASPVPIPNTPSSLVSSVKAPPTERVDDSGPYKADMMLRMEQLERGDRVRPPCDRCRRLHMDCLKNLTACIGCTKKHAKCSWKDVEAQELKDHPIVPRAARTVREHDGQSSDGDGDGDGDGEERHSPSCTSNGRTKKRRSREEQGEVRDEELLGEDSDEDMDIEPPKERLTEPHEMPSPHAAPKSVSEQGQTPIGLSRQVQAPTSEVRPVTATTDRLPGNSDIKASTKHDHNVASARPFSPFSIAVSTSIPPAPTRSHASTGSSSSPPVIPGPNVPRDISPGAIPAASTKMDERTKDLYRQLKSAAIEAEAGVQVREDANSIGQMEFAGLSRRAEEC